MILKLTNNSVFGKAMKNVRNQRERDIKLATTNKRIKYLASEPNYHRRNCFSENLLATEIKNKKKNE